VLKRFSFLLVLTSRQRWPEETLCRWLLMAAVAPPYLINYPQASRDAITMSALPPKADMCGALGHVR
ncbi:MAG: hypothetical protein WAL03_13680, partial [Pseudolabrys sp.]